MSSSAKVEFEVILQGRAKIQYLESDRKLTFGSEFMAGSEGIVIYSDNIDSWDSQHDSEPLSVVDLERIKANTLFDLARQKIKAEWA